MKLYLSIIIITGELGTSAASRSGLVNLCASGDASLTPPPLSATDVDYLHVAAAPMSVSVMVV